MANRLLPVGLDHRADWEINTLFAVWGGVFVWGIARPMRADWAEAMGACAVLWIAVPLASQLTTERGLLASLMSRDWVYVAFDPMALSAAFAFAFAARKIAGHQPKRPPRHTAQAAPLPSSSSRSRGGPGSGLP